ncbi:MAG: F0F1 ATP synthase subunit gamma, partial [Anaerolineales bacterium]|nr:F0F1 ATP synthase subunit gamma [Anaerolineales bacterium]
MAEGLERAQNRLANIRGVDPLLGALRTISLGSWQAALKRKVAATRYREHLMSLLPSLLPSLRSSKRVLGKKPLSVSQIAVLVVGSERGLCGRFNKVIAEHTEQYLEKHKTDGIQVDLWALGSRVIRTFKRRQRTLAWSDVLSTTSLPSYRLAHGLVHHWLSSFEGGDLDAVDVLYNVYLGA